MLRFDHISSARYDKGRIDVRDAEQGLEPAQAAIAAPVLCQFNCRTGEIAEFLELALEALEQGEGIGGAAGKPGQYFATVQPAHFSGIALHHALCKRHLSVAAD